MHDDDSSRRELLNHEEDDRTEAAVMGLVLEQHPAQLTLTELALMMVGANQEYKGTDAVERAVRDLVGTGLLHRNGDTIRPTVAALRFHDLLIAR
jgi:hypothetical protein